MRIERSLGTAFVMALAGLALGCGGTMQTGTAKRPTNNKPAADGTCPIGTSPCGSSAFTICVDLQNDTGHCGVCGRTCSPGIACQAGACQQTVCTGETTPFSGQPPTGTSSAIVPPITSAEALLADVNGDGQLDLVEWTSALIHPPPDRNNFRVSLGQPGGGFAEPDTYETGANVLHVYVVDVNSDGADDLLVVANTSANTVTSPYRVELWLGGSSGLLTRSDAAGGGGTLVTPVMAMDDLSGDGWPDLVLQKSDLDSSHPGSLDVYLSDSVGALHLSASYGTGWGSVGAIVIRDWNGDGSPDLAAMNDGLQMLYNRGDGTFEPAVVCGVGLGVYMGANLVVEDFNHDGYMDLVQELGYAGPRLGVLLGTGGCGFSPITYYDLPGTPAGQLRAVDVNGDGQLDLVAISGVTAGGEPTVVGTRVEDYLLTVLLGNPDGTFAVQTPATSLGPDVAAVTVGEVSGDQRPDVIVSTADGHSTTWENTCQ